MILVVLFLFCFGVFLVAGAMNDDGQKGDAKTLSKNTEPKLLHLAGGLDSWTV